ncbi:dihydroorotase [Egibacter rhizosphaerae]|uniref:Dihydroorotase n=1 Tax=Egibacter rhizosphaerae TaxID=1670831 RepID=A0A411YLN3_9ACTN|nr:dihydroorotase [Egibacter rhizosphaerae]
MTGQLLTFTGARVVDPARGVDEIANVVVEDDRIASAGEESRGLRIDAAGLVISPGLVDLHTHLREPGGEDAETVATGTAAAAVGGYTAVCAMANTDPVCDHAGVVEQVLRLARDAARCDVFPTGAITRGLGGSELAEMGSMAALGVGCFSDDGHPVQSARVLRQAMAYARTWDAIICNHAEDSDLAAGGQLHAGEVAGRLGLSGRPAEAEEIMVARDLRLAASSGVRLHVPHVSTAGAVELIREAKARGVRVTAEVTPHHLCLTDESAVGYDPVFKVNPPLRTSVDIDALRRGLADGTIDAIATDHAPHSHEQKDQEWTQAPPGMVGLETALAVTLTELVPDDELATPGGAGGAPPDGLLSLSGLVDRLSTRPAAVWGLSEHGGPLEVGAPATFTVFDPQERWTVDPAALRGRARNTPFAGRRLRGRVRYTLLRGRFTCRDGEPAEPLATSPAVHP